MPDSEIAVDGCFENIGDVIGEHTFFVKDTEFIDEGGAFEFDGIMFRRFDNEDCLGYGDEVLIITFLLITITANRRTSAFHITAVAANRHTGTLFIVAMRAHFYTKA